MRPSTLELHSSTDAHRFKYTYDANNRVTGVTKLDGSVTSTVFDHMQRVTSTVERTAEGTVITGFEYTYDDLSRVVEEKVLANSTKMCYTYDNLNRVTKRTVKNFEDAVLSEETFSYDAAGNVTSAPREYFGYDANNRLIFLNGEPVSYDADGNMLSNGVLSCTYDAKNRLLSAGGHTYTYNAESVRIRNLCEKEDTVYTYDTSRKLSRLLCKTTNGVMTKYVYGRGLIGEETDGEFKIYHFDSRGSTVALTDEDGNLTDTFAYDTYGKLIDRTGTSKVIFGYNGRDGVVTDDNGLIYMRARYYSPEMKRFINADIVAGEISNAVTLNRFAYANGNPVSFVDPFGLSVERGNYTQAVLVSNFNYSFPINITGHTQLYFWDHGNKKWYLTEFSGSTKSNATVKFIEKTPPMYNSATGQCDKTVDGINYVVLNGNFNESVALAKQYAGIDQNGNRQNFGRYNFLFNNCSDYTDELLGVADIDGMYAQIWSEGNSLISIPVLRELDLSLASFFDSIPTAIADGLRTAGHNLSGTSPAGDIAGGVLTLLGDFVEETTDFIGDVVDAVNDVVNEVVDGVKYVASAVTNGIVDAWNWLFG